jgi:hypothetical protein
MKLFRAQRPVASDRGGTNSRSGLSLLEFLGCTIALVGGAWLGAIYLGINVNHLSYTALEEADLLDTIPDRWRPAAPDGSDKFRGMSREELVTSLRDELSALRNEITTLKATDEVVSSATPAAATAAPKTADSSTATGPSLEKTMAYWNRLSEIALGEAALQRDADLAFTDDNADNVLIIKGRISRFAAKAVEVIPREQVDSAVVQLGRQLGEWYGRGGDLYENAVRIQSFPSENTNHDRLTREWRLEDAQHRNEAQMLSNRAIAVRDEMRRRFETDFPMFGQPPAEADPTESPQESEDG